jgi:hypothetical protein
MKPTLQPVTVLHKLDQATLRNAYSSYVLNGCVEDTSTAHEKMQLALDIDAWPTKRLPAEYMVRDEENSKFEYNELLNRIETTIICKWMPCHVYLIEGKFFLADVFPIIEVYANGSLAVETMNALRWRRAQPLSIKFTIQAPEKKPHDTFRGPKFRPPKSTPFPKNRRSPWRIITRRG